MRVWGKILVGLAGLAVLIVAGLGLRYAQDMRAVKERLAEASMQIETPKGIVEYTTWGEGPPALVIHGAGGGFDQGELLARHLFGDGFRWIAVSRFGYLGSPMPDDASTPAQADAIAALLDTLDIDQVAVFGVSGGVPPALQLAIRHGDRVSALVLASSAPFTPWTVEEQGLPLPPAVYQAMFQNDFLFWLAAKTMPTRMDAAFDVTPQRRAALSEADKGLVDGLVAAFLPVSRRFDGIVNEIAALDPGTLFPLEEITAPTLVIHSHDDGLNPFRIARDITSRIPGAQLLVFESGGHLLLGHRETIRKHVAEFLREIAPR